MAHVGIALMLEQLSASEAVDVARAASRAGLGGIMASDVLQPWVPPASPAQRAPHMWSVLSAAGAGTGGTLGGVITPNYRHHPATIAQASATLASMYPGRHWLGLSAGEALNDAPVTRAWPRAPERIDAMFEAADLIAKIFSNSAAGRETRIHGDHAMFDSARLWTIPVPTPKVLIATAGPLTARRAGRHTDGIVTMATGLDRARVLVERFNQGREDMGKNLEGTLRVVRMHVSWAASIEQATTNALRNRPQAAMRFNISDIRSPFDFAQIAKIVRPEDFAGNLLITDSADAIVAQIRDYRALGFDEIYLHNAGDDHETWIGLVESQILPALR